MVICNDGQVTKAVSGRKHHRHNIGNLIHNGAYSVQTIELVLRPMDGVAYTTGSETAKEIHFACQHIVNSADRCADEIRGVLVHEVVHCFQYNGRGTCPGGLIEGIAGVYSSFFFSNLAKLLVTPHSLQIGSASVPVSRPHIGVPVGIAGTRAITSLPIF